MTQRRFIRLQCELEFVSSTEGDAPGIFVQLKHEIRNVHCENDASSSTEPKDECNPETYGTLGRTEVESFNETKLERDHEKEVESRTKIEELLAHIASREQSDKVAGEDFKRISQKRWKEAAHSIRDYIRKLGNKAIEVTVAEMIKRLFGD